MSKLNRLIFALSVFFLTINYLAAQEYNLWLSYGQATFLYSPGIEMSTHFNKHFGVQGAVNAYFQVVDKNRVVNLSDDYFFNFYNANIGLCKNIITTTKSKLAINLGAKMYYGPYYDKLLYYTMYYYIYKEASQFKPSFGLDMGLSYTYNKYSGIIKYDTARNYFRFGVGYSWGRINDRENKF